MLPCLTRSLRPCCVTSCSARASTFDAVRLTRQPLLGPLLSAPAADVQPQAQLLGLADALASAVAVWLRVPRPGCALLELEYSSAPSGATAGLGPAVARTSGRAAFGAPCCTLFWAVVTDCSSSQAHLSWRTCLRRTR